MGSACDDMACSWKGCETYPACSRLLTGRHAGPAAVRGDTAYRSAVGFGRLRDLLQGVPGQFVVAGLDRQVAERDDADQPLVAVEDHQPADLLLLHEPG